MNAPVLTGRSRWVGLAGAGIALAASVAVVVVGLGVLSPAEAAAEGATSPTTTASVERRTLIEQEAFSGTLGYSGELRVVNEIQTSGQADVSTLAQAVVTAQAAYDNAIRTVEAIKQPTVENKAAARAQVRSAEANLASAKIAAKGSTPAQLQAAVAQVAQAQAALAAAKSSANGPTASQLASAQAQLAQAKAGLITAQNAANGPTAVQRTQAEAAVAHAQINLTTDQEAVAVAQRALGACLAGGGASPSSGASPTPPPDCSSATQAVIQAEARVASDEQDLRVAQAQLDALTSAAGQSEAQAALASAQAQVVTAQATLDALTGSDAIASAQAQVAVADAAVRSAQAVLDELTSPDATSQRAAQVRAAQAQLQAAQASLAAILNPSAAALAEAVSNATVARSNLDAAKGKLDQLRGAVTWLPATGAIVERGGPLYELDGEPSGILLYGTRPAWREMAEGTVGEDVRQLQENLIALGLGTAELTASGEFDAQTAAAVKRWQKGLGRPETGRVELGEVVFQPGAVRIAGQSLKIGATATAGSEILTATSIERVVTVNLEADEQALVSAGDIVEVELPDGSNAPGKVETVGTVATASADGQSPPTIEVTIVLDDPAASGTVDQAPVDVRITTISREDVLAVPVNALLALLEGGYAVEVSAGDGTTQLVGVETGIFQDGWVEIDLPNGGLTEGDKVVVPS